VACRREGSITPIEKHLKSEIKSILEESLEKGGSFIANLELPDGQLITICAAVDLTARLEIEKTFQKLLKRGSVKY
jgi:hypothetical protein